ncbi:MAG: hypothetical protein K1X94_36215 [Sandaracinaceae bacterium]|nr:hypothetical protein [Sandaracinaceae bacterium]
MMFVISWIWTALAAALVAWLMERGISESVEAVERGEDVPLRRGDPTFAFVVCFLFLISAPFFLAQARGGRGFVEGVFIVLGATALSTASVVGLSLLYGA